MWLNFDREEFLLNRRDSFSHATVGTWLDPHKLERKIKRLIFLVTEKNLMRIFVSLPLILVLHIWSWDLNLQNVSPNNSDFPSMQHQCNDMIKAWDVYCEPGNGWWMGEMWWKPGRPPCPPWACSQYGRPGGHHQKLFSFPRNGRLKKRSGEIISFMN